MRMLASRFTKSTQTWQHKVSVQVARLRCNFMTLNRFCVLRLHSWFAISVTRSSRKAAKAEEHHAANWTFRIRSPGRWIDVQTDSPGRCSKSEDRMNACFGESVCYDHKLEMQSPELLAARKPKWNSRTPPPVAWELGLKHDSNPHCSCIFSHVVLPHSE